uniref:Uncharacterized protein n=1 Tax=Arundo donax TaxID=35708 RepID=A0A0A9E3Y3_ARUDO
MSGRKISSCLRRTATYASHRPRKSLLVTAGKKEKMGKLVMERRIRSCSFWISSSASAPSLAPRLMYTSSSNRARRNSCLTSTALDPSSPRARRMSATTASRALRLAGAKRLTRAGCSASAARFRRTRRQYGP